jgi:hypothetical protein
MPIVVMGGFIDIALSANWMMRLEGSLTGGVAARDGRAASYGYATGLLGFGYVL